MPTGGRFFQGGVELMNMLKGSPMPIILWYLQSLLEKQLSASTLKVYVVAISARHVKVDTQRFCALCPDSTARLQKMSCCLLQYTTGPCGTRTPTLPQSGSCCYLCCGIYILHVTVTLFPLFCSESQHFSSSRQTCYEIILLCNLTLPLFFPPLLIISHIVVKS